MKTVFKFKQLKLCFIAAALAGGNLAFAQAAKWTKYASQGSYLQTCADLASDGQGNVYTAGWFTYESDFDGTFSSPYYMSNDDGSGTYEDGYLSKTARDGSMGTANEWAIKASHASGTSTANERVTAVATYPDGVGGVNTYICGTYNGSLKFTRYNYDGSTTTYTTTITSSSGQGGFVAKFDHDGALKWCYKLDGSGTDIMYDVCVNNDGSNGVTVYVCGYFQGSSGNSISCTGSSSTVSVSSLVVGGTEGFLMRFDDAGNSADPQWGKAMASTGNDSYYGAAAAPNGDVVVTGQIRSGSSCIDAGGTSVTVSGSNDVIVARYNVSGTRTYKGTFGGASTGSGSYDAGIAVAMDGDGNSYVAGYFTCNTTMATAGLGNDFTGGQTLSNLGSSANTWDYFIAKIDNAAACQWLKGGGTTNDGDAIQGIVVDNLGQRVYATGNFKGNFTYNGSGTLFSSYSSTNLDGFLLTADASTGSIVSGGATYFGGSSHDDNGRAIAINSAEDIFVGGATSSIQWQVGGSGTPLYNNNTSGGTYEAYLFRWDHSNWPAYTSSSLTTHVGVGEWYNGPDYLISSVGYFNGSSITFPNVAGSISSTQNSIGNYTYDVFASTCSKFGDYQSVAVLMNGNSSEIAADACVDASGNQYYTGYAATGAAGPNITFTNGVGSYTGSGRTASFVGKCDKNGSNQWGVFLQPSSSGDVTAYGICTDASGNVYVTGGFTDYFTVLSNTVTATSATDIFVVKLNSNGTFGWAKNFGSTSSGSEYGNSISVDNSGNYYVTGEYNTAGTLTFGSNALSSTTYGDIFVMKGSTSSPGNASKGYAINGTGQDYGYRVLSPNSTETYIACTRNTGSYAYIASVDLTIATPALNWSVSSTTGTGYASASATEIDMANGYLYVSGATGSGTLEFSPKSESASGDGYLVCMASWNGVVTCLTTFDISGTTTTPRALAIESGVLADDHGDNAIIAGDYSGKAFTHKFTAEGCIPSERRPGPVEETVSNSVSVSNVYPNPSGRTAVLELGTETDAAEEPATIVILDMTGRVVQEIGGVTGQRVDIETGSLPNGIYLYRVIRSGQSVNSGKMMVQH